MKAKIHGFEMAYDDTGAVGAPLLLIHGFPLDRTLWLAQTNGLADMARVIAPDLRGAGESGLPPGPVTMDTYADDLSALLDSLGVKSAIVGGLSMGGYIAFAFYRKYPHRVRALVLADTRPQPDSAEAKKMRDANAALARDQGVGAVAERLLPKLLAPKTFESRPEVAKGARELMARQPVEGVVAQLMALRDRPDSTPTLAQISVPTLVIVGAEDALTPPKDSEMMRDAIRGARLVTIPDAAHLSNYEQPEQFNNAVREFCRPLI
ncbi:MAG: alpha/beta fold hydrolase [Chloroflexi bacterium]|nr:alpha/beta fold hydrolase [Chloroflexota bacterium]